MRCSLLLLLLLLQLSALAQKQGNIWHFGPGLGLDFSSGAPVMIGGGQTGTYKGSPRPQEGTSAISDLQGRLLCYTGGLCIWNRFHQIMPHGDSLAGHNSSTQSSIIVPRPGSNNLMYVFTSSSIDALFPPAAGTLPRGYRYTVLDMCLDGARGDVVSGQKNILLADSNSEKLAACKAGGTGGGYWILGHGAFTDSFFAWRLTSSSISSPVITQIGYRARNGGEMIGQMKFDPTGNMVAVTYATATPPAIELFDFDNATGVLRNLCRIPIAGGSFGNYLYSMEFSPDGSKLYVGVSQGTDRRIYQYQVLTATCNGVLSSEFLLHSSKLVSGGTTAMQAGPDGRIYVADSSNRIGCITTPNASGSAAGYNPSAITVSPANNFLSFPNFIAGFQYSNGVVNCVTAVPEKPFLSQAVSVYPNPARSGRVICAYKGAQQIRQVHITAANLAGQTIFSRTYQPGSAAFSQDVDLPGAATGTYLLRVDLDGDIITKSVIVH